MTRFQTYILQTTNQQADGPQEANLPQKLMRSCEGAPGREG